MNKLPLSWSFVALAASFIASAAQAQTTVKDPWARATVAQQKASGAFMQLQSAKGGKLLSASSPVAGIVEIHEMLMDGDVMKMRAVSSLNLPAGKAVELKPGGHHVMLIDLKKQLIAGDTVPIILVVESAGQRETVEVKAVVRAPGAAGAAAHKGHHGHKH
ncbi:MAG: copper chaperone PCu(A)C [Rubrivivax sp.]